jgi:aconitate hydratase
VVYALAGSTRINVQTDPIATNAKGVDVYLKDIWPSNSEVQAAMAAVNSEMFSKQYADVFRGDEHWRSIQVEKSSTYPWDENSTYIRNPPFFIDQDNQQEVDINGAKVLALLGDSITTDHISPAGAIAVNSPAGRWLIEQGVEKKDFNSYGSRRGNHEVMMRGTFANIRIKNEMCPGTEGGVTQYIPSGETGSAETMSIYDAAMAYQQNNTPLVVIAGKEYGTGSSRDWAAKGTRLLGVKAVIAESFERIHRSNLIGMGVLPLQFIEGISRTSLALNGSEAISICGISQAKPNGKITMIVARTDGSIEECQLLSRIDTDDELQYFKAGGILHYVLNQLKKD